MAKDKNKKKDTKKQDSTADEEIARAEARLVKALRDVERARNKLAKRERQLLALLEAHGRLSAPDSIADAADASHSTADADDADNASDRQDMVTPETTDVSLAAVGVTQSETDASTALATTRD